MGPEATKSEETERSHSHGCTTSFKKKIGWKPSRIGDFESFMLKEPSLTLQGKGAILIAWVKGVMGSLKHS